MARRSVALSAPAKNREIQIGPSFQAVIPECTGDEKDDVKASCLFSFNEAQEKGLVEADIQKVIDKGAEHSINETQALAFLHFKGYNMRRTLGLMHMFGQFPELWDDEDQKLLEDGLATFGKDFFRIQELLPHKTTSDLVDRYYKIKKKMRLKVANHQGGRKKRHSDDDENSSYSLSSSVEKEEEDTPPSSVSSSISVNLKAEKNGSSPPAAPSPPPVPKTVRKRRTKKKYHVMKSEPNTESEPKKGESPPANGQKYSKALPPGFHFDKDEFLSFMQRDEATRNAELKQVSREYEKAKAESCERRKKIDYLEAVAVTSVEDLRPNPELSTPTPEWNPREIMLVLVIFNEFGVDCNNAAEIIGTKCVEQVEEYLDLMKENLPNFDQMFSHDN